MIKFFRRVRQQLLTENKFSKYLLYAIGEIVLVVIGILIALSINNWNENEKLKQKEVSIAAEIYRELDENIATVNKEYQIWNRRQINVQKISDLIASNNHNIQQREFDSIMLYVIGFYNFELKNSKFIKIIASESIEFKRSKKISSDMLSLNFLYNSLTVYFQRNENNYHNVVQPYLIKNYSYRNFNNTLLQEKTNSKVDHNKLLADFEFDNIIQTVIGNNAPFVQIIKHTITKMEDFKDTLEEVYPSLKKDLDD